MSYDVVITNSSDRDLLLPLVLMLDPAEGYEGVPRDAAGQTPMGQWLIDLSDALASGDALEPGDRTVGRTITIDNPDWRRVDYAAGFSAHQGANQSPVFDSQPVTDAVAGQPYTYQVDAHDPDAPRSSTCCTTVRRAWRSIR